MTSLYSPTPIVHCNAEAADPPAAAALPAGAFIKKAGGAHILLVGLGIFICALFLRLTFVAEVIEQNRSVQGDPATAAQAGFLTSDSDAYIQLARNFSGAYFDGQLSHYALLRTPGYPTFCLPFYACGAGPGSILVGQALLASCIPVLTLLCAYLMTRGNLVLSGLAGFVSAICPSGIGLCGLIMSDMLFAFLVAAGLAALYGGAVRTRPGWVMGSGIFFSAALLVKPILLLWPLAMVPLYALFCKSQSAQTRWKALALALALQLLVMGLWCARNYCSTGIFALSSVSNYSLHDFVRPRVEEWVRFGGLPPNQAVRKNRDTASRMADQQTEGLAFSEKLSFRRSRSLAVFRSHPMETAKVVLHNIQEHTCAGWDYFYRQLPRSRALANLLGAAAARESLVKKNCLLIGAIFFCCLLVWSVLMPGAENRRALALGSALAIAYGYFALLAGATLWAGSRIMYPAECILILFMALALQAAAKGCTSLLALAPGSFSALRRRLRP